MCSRLAWVRVMTLFQVIRGGKRHELREKKLQSAFLKCEFHICVFSQIQLKHIQEIGQTQQCIPELRRLIWVGISEFANLIYIPSFRLDEMMTCCLQKKKKPNKQTKKNKCFRKTTAVVPNVYRIPPRYLVINAPICIVLEVIEVYRNTG